MASRSRTRCSPWWIIGIVLILVAVVGIATITTIYFAPGCLKDQYGLVFDAGSSHTDISIFRWAGEKIEGTGMVTEITKCDVEGPGISSYAVDSDKKPEGAGESLEACLSEVEKKIPKDRADRTRIFLGATAGMRLLNLESPEKSNAVFESVRKTLDKSEFKYEPDHVRIISDREEGIYAWTAANLLDGNLGVGEKQTVGTLDLGGASTQIAFVSQPSEGQPNVDDFVPLRLYGVDYTVFSHSYLCYGLKEALRRYRSELVMAAPADVSDIFDPCFPVGYEERQHTDFLFDQVCTLKSDARPGNARTITFSGRSHPEECTNKVRILLDAEDCTKKQYKECLNGSLVPPINGRFVAISGYSTTTYFLNLANATREEFNQGVDNFCRKQWLEVKEMKAKLIHLPNYCFGGQYIREILQTAYKFGSETTKWEQVEFVKTIGGAHLGWSLGFMANATNAIPTEDPNRKMSLSLYLPLLIGFIVLLFIVLVFVIRAWKKRQGQSSFPV